MQTGRGKKPTINITLNFVSCQNITNTSTSLLCWIQKTRTGLRSVIDFFKNQTTIQQQRFRTLRITVKFGSLNCPSCRSLSRHSIFSHLSDIHDDISEIAVILLHNAEKRIWRTHPETGWCHFIPSVWKVNVYTIWQWKPQLMNSRKIFPNPPISPAW